MNSIKHSIKNFINDEAGVTAIEYALIAAVVAVVMVAGAKTLGTNLSAKFTSVAGTVANP